MMNYSEELQKLLAETILPELETFMRKLQEHIDAHGMSDELQQDQQGVRMLHDHFLDLRVSVEEGELGEEQCKQLFEEISTMRQMGNEGAL